MAGDPYFAQRSLGLHFDGANGSTTFADNSPSPKTVTAYGNAKVSTAQSKFGGASGYFGGVVGDYLQTPANVGFGFPGDFTVSVFVYLAGYGQYGSWVAGNYQSGNGGWSIEISGSTSYYVQVSFNTGSTGFAFPKTFALNTWYHVAVTRSAGVIRCFVDGVQVGSSYANADTVSGSWPLYVGRRSDAAATMNGYLDDLLIYKGVALWTSNFAPPSGPFSDYALPIAQGFQTGYFGTPHLPYQVIGFRSAELGMPSLALKTSGIAAASALGTPAGKIHYTPLGFAAAGFGLPRTTLAAQGLAGSAFGIPSIPLNVSSIAAASAFGTPTGRNIQVVSGLTSGAFGLPRVAPRAVGFSTSAFGIGTIPLIASAIAPDPRFGIARGRLYQRASGISGGAFGSPRVVPRAVGFTSSQFGATGFRQYLRASPILPTSVLSPAYRPVTQTAQATGFAPGQFGTPLVTRSTIRIAGVTAQAFGFSGAALGSPSASWLQIATASGFTSGSVGAPRSVAWYAAQGFISGAFGTPAAHQRGHAQGFATAILGTPTLRMVTHAASTRAASHFGLPAATKAHTYCAYGFTNGPRFGQPRGRARIVRAAAGFRGGELGTPVCHERHRVLHMPPTARFGTHLLRMQAT